MSRSPFGGGAHDGPRSPKDRNERRVQGLPRVRLQGRFPFHVQEGR